MRQWKAKSVAASNDDELADFINGIESEPDCNVKEVIFIGNDPIGTKLYQILYVEGQQNIHISVFDFRQKMLYGI